MTMTAEQLEKLSLWHTTVTLMGVDVDDLDNDWDGDDHHFNGLLGDLETHYKRMANPSNTMKAVLLTHEMGLNTDDIDCYVQHLYDERLEREEQERLYRIETNPEIVRLRDEFNFQFITSKQYPNHQHFTFKDKKGLEIRGRVFRSAWAQVRVWLYWKDKKGKAQSLRNDYNLYHHAVKYPEGFPYEWSEGGYNSSLDPKRVPFMIAKRVIDKKMEKGFAYPKA